MELDEAAYPPTTEPELLSWLPEIDDISSDDIRDETVFALLEGPDYFWTAAAASKYHPREHRQRHGLVLHTKRVVTAFERTADSIVKQGHLTREEVDMGRAACLLHDLFKYGEPPTSVQNTTKDHDVVAANWLAANTELPSAVIGAVESHNGPYYVGKSPTSHLEQMVHVADMTASDTNMDVAVKDLNETLADQFPRVSQR